MLHTIEGTDSFGTHAASNQSVSFFLTPKFFWVPNISLPMQMTVMAACHTLTVKLGHQLSCFFGTSCCSVTKKNLKKIHSKFSRTPGRDAEKQLFGISRFVPNKKASACTLFENRGGGVATSVAGKIDQGNTKLIGCLLVSKIHLANANMKGFGTLRSLGFRIFLQSYRNKYS